MASDALIDWPCDLVDLDDPSLEGQRWSFASDFRYAAALACVPIVPTEFLRVAHEYVIGFMRRGDDWSAVAVLRRGLPDAPFPNQFVDAQGRWAARYIPYLVRVYPFAPVLGDEGTLRIRLAADPARIGPGHRHACRSGAAASEEILAVAAQITGVLAALPDQTHAVNTLAAAGILTPVSNGETGDTGLHVVAAGADYERFQASAAYWYRTAPTAVQLAIAANFSYRRRPDLLEAGRPEARGNRRQDEGARLAPPPAPQTLTWLDVDDKVTF